MKKISLLVALAIILAVAAPVFAGPFSDVPANHWAYEALNKVVATGIISGYQDGTFRGTNTMNRYEIAVVVSRILDKVAAERVLLAEKVDALENGLTAGQAEDTIAIFKSLLAKEREKMIAEIKAAAPAQSSNTETVVEKTTELVLPENLTEAQAAEVAAIVEALSMEFKFELAAIGARLDAIEASVGRIDDLDSRLAKVEDRATITGKYSVSFRRYDTNGNGTPYFDPFKLDYDEWQEYEDDGTPIYDAGYDYYYPDFNRMEHKVTVGIDAQKGDLSADLDIVAFRDRFDSNYTVDTALANWYFLNGVVTGNNFEAVIGHGQELTLRPYLFNKHDDYGDRLTYNGIVINADDAQLAIVKYKAEDLASGDPAVTKNFLTLEKGLGLLDSTLYVGLEDVIVSNNFVAGLNVPADFLTIDFNAEAAVQQIDGENYKYVTIDAKRVLGSLSVEGNYTLRDAEFVGIEGEGIRKDGYTGKVKLDLLNGKVKADGTYENYNVERDYYYDSRYDVNAEVAFGPLTASYDYETAIKEGLDNTHREKRNVDLNQKLAFLTLNAGYKYDQYDDYLEKHGETHGEKFFKDYEYNHVYGNITADLFIPGLTAVANYRYSLKGDSYGSDLTAHKYGVKLVKGIFGAGYTYNVVGKGHDYNASINPEAINVFGFSIDTNAGVKVSDYAETKLDYNVAVDVKKALNKQSNFTYNFLYDNRGLPMRNRFGYSTGLNGLKVKHTGIVDYAITDSLKANVTYISMDFTGEDEANSYNVQELKTGLSFNF